MLHEEYLHSAAIFIRERFIYLIYIFAYINQVVFFILTEFSYEHPYFIMYLEYVEDKLIVFEWPAVSHIIKDHCTSSPGNCLSAIIFMEGLLPASWLVIITDASNDTFFSFKYSIIWYLVTSGNTEG